MDDVSCRVCSSNMFWSDSLACHNLEIFARSRQRQDLLDAIYLVGSSISRLYQHHARVDVVRRVTLYVHTTDICGIGMNVRHRLSKSDTGIIAVVDNEVRSSMHQ